MAPGALARRRLDSCAATDGRHRRSPGAPRGAFRGAWRKNCSATFKCRRHHHFMSPFPATCLGDPPSAFGPVFRQRFGPLRRTFGQHVANFGRPKFGPCCPNGGQMPGPNSAKTWPQAADAGPSLRIPPKTCELSRNRSVLIEFRPHPSSRSNMSAFVGQRRSSPGSPRVTFRDAWRAPVRQLSPASTGPPPSQRNMGSASPHLRQCWPKANQMWGMCGQN